MADKKISTIILVVDLDCSCCVKKITKTLKKYPEIKTQILNHEKKTVTISGPFDPEKLMKCICCKAGKYIKSYEIVIDKPKPDPPKKPETKLAGKPEPDPPKKVDPPKPKPDTKPEAPKPDPPKKSEDPPKTEVPKPEPPKPKPPVVVPVPPAPAPEPVIPARPYPVPVCCGPCYGGHGGGPCWHGWAPQPCPPPIWGRPCYEGYGAGPHSSPYAPSSACRFFSEEESSCRTM